MNKLLLVISILSLTGCSTLKRTLIYSSLIGGFAGSATGVVLSPNKESRKGNALLFGAVGAVASGLIGYALYKDDPRNYELKHMLMDEENKKLDIDLGGLNIDASLKAQDIYKVPVKELPVELKGKVNQQYLIKYKSKERIINKGKKTYYIPDFEIYEHAYGKDINQN